MAIGGREFVMDYNVVPASYKIEIRIASPDPNNTDTRTIIAELDTGTDCTYIPNDIITELDLKPTGYTGDIYGADLNLPPMPIKFYYAKVIIDGIDEATIEVGGVDGEEDGFSPLVGRDLINRWHILFTPHLEEKSKIEIASMINYRFGDSAIIPIS